MIRSITGVGEGHGPFMAIHDGFRGLSSWGGFLPGSDRIIMGMRFRDFLPEVFN